MSVRVFLTSDLHLGMKFAQYPAAHAELEEERFLCLERMVAEAGAAHCDLLVIAGDLFHRVSMSRRDTERAAQAIRAFPGKCVAVLPGQPRLLLAGRRALAAFSGKERGRRSFPGPAAALLRFAATKSMHASTLGPVSRFIPRRARSGGCGAGPGTRQSATTSALRTAASRGSPRISLTAISPCRPWIFFPAGMDAWFLGTHARAVSRTAFGPGQNLLPRHSCSGRLRLHTCRISVVDRAG